VRGAAEGTRENALEYSRTAQALGISRNTLYRKIHKHNIVLEQ